MTVNFLSTKIDMSQNSKCWFCGDKDEMFYDIISDCNKLAQN